MKKKKNPCCLYVAQLQQLLQNNWEESLVMDFHASCALGCFLLSCGIKTEIGWHCFFMPELSHIIHGEFLGIIIVCLLAS